MVNEVNANASIQRAITSVPHSPESQTVPAKKNKDVQEVEFHRQEQAAVGKEVPQVVLSEKESVTQATEEEVIAAVSQIQEHVQNIERDLEFRIDEESGRTVVTVIDPETDEVVRQIPSEEILRITNHLNRMSNGLLMEVKA